MVQIQLLPPKATACSGKAASLKSNQGGRFLEFFNKGIYNFKQFLLLVSWEFGRFEDDRGDVFVVLAWGGQEFVGSGSQRLHDGKEAKSFQMGSL